MPLFGESFQSLQAAVKAKFETVQARVGEVADGAIQRFDQARYELDNWIQGIDSGDMDPETLDRYFAEGAAKMEREAAAKMEREAAAKKVREAAAQTKRERVMAQNAADVVVVQQQPSTTIPSTSGIFIKVDKAPAISEQKVLTPSVEELVALAIESAVEKATASCNGSFEHPSTSGIEFENEEIRQAQEKLALQVESLRESAKLATEWFELTSKKKGGQFAASKAIYMAQEDSFRNELVEEGNGEEEGPTWRDVFCNVWHCRWSSLALQEHFKDNEKKKEMQAAAAAAAAAAARPAEGEETAV